MIPLFATIHVRRAGGVIRLWAPIFLLWILMIPIAILLAIPLLIVCLIRGVSPIESSVAIAGIIGGLAGTRVEVDSPTATVLVRIF